MPTQRIVNQRLTFASGASSEEPFLLYSRFKHQLPRPFLAPLALRAQCLPPFHAGHSRRWRQSGESPARVRRESGESPATVRRQSDRPATSGRAGVHTFQTLHTCLHRSIEISRRAGPSNDLLFSPVGTKVTRGNVEYKVHAVGTVNSKLRTSNHHKFFLTQTITPPPSTYYPPPKKNLRLSKSPPKVK